MTRVLYLINNLGIGGAEKVLLSLAAGLDRSRFECRVACLGRNLALRDEFERRGAPVVALDGASQADPRAWLRLGALVRAWCPHVIHGHLWRANMLARLVGRREGVPVVVTTEHSVQFDGPVRERLNRLTARLSSSVVCVSQAARRHALERIGIPAELLTVIHNGVDVERYTVVSARSEAKERLGLPADRPIVGTVARHSRVKRLDRFLAAAQAVQRERPEVLFVTAGDGPTLPALRARARALGVDVTFLGRREDVAEVLHAFDVFLLTSETEGFPLSVIEAMSAGCPVVGMLAGGVGDVLRDGVEGLVVRQGDVAGAARAVLAALADEGLAGRLTEAARLRAAKDLSTEAMVRAHEALYESLLLRFDESR